MALNRNYLKSVLLPLLGIYATNLFVDKGYKVNWFKNVSDLPNGPKYIFKNRGIKYRKNHEIHNEYKETLLRKGYNIFEINSQFILAKNLKRAIQTEKRLQYI